MTAGPALASLSPDVSAALRRWGRKNYRDLPWRDAPTLWQALVAEVLLQRTRAGQVIPVYKRFLEEYPTPASLGEASEDDVYKLVRSLGLRWRAPLLHRLFGAIAARGGTLELDRDWLESLPGVGPYAASALLSLHSGQREVLIDANTVRVMCRLVGRPYDGETRRKGWLRDLAEALTPRRAHRSHNYAMLDLAAAICVPRTPRCEVCPIVNRCVTGQRRTGGHA